VANPLLPGRLGRPDLTLKDDPRADPRMVEALVPLGLGVAPPAASVTRLASLEAILAHCKEAEEGFKAVGTVLAESAPPVPGVVSRTEVIRGVDGNEIKLYIPEPEAANAPSPCVVHTHGGGMVLLEAANANYKRWRDELAAAGLVAIGVEFRNGAGVLGPHPFPAGLNDCASATRWAISNRKNLRISKIIVSGESGGGNLAIATALKAKQDGWVDGIAGIYAQCPYVSNLWSEPPAELPSLVENDGYLINVSDMPVLARAYDPDGENATNPLAWPYHATGDDLTGLPPHVISVNELDPLRDEGLAFYRKLLDAGVSAVGRTVNGTCHAADCLFLDAIPEVCRATIRDIASFAESLG
jgi:acetyl esterase